MSEKAFRDQVGAALADATATSGATVVAGHTGEILTAPVPPGVAAQVLKTVLDELTVKVPEDDDFAGDFMASEDLENLALRLCRKHADRHFILDWRLTVLWKKRGGARSGRATFGKCVKPSGLAKHFSESDWVIWLAADHVRNAEYSVQQIEALLYHELLHCALTEPEEDDEAVYPAIVGHDLEIFVGEVEEYGLWRPGLKDAAPVFARQLEMFE